MIRFLFLFLAFTATSNAMPPEVRSIVAKIAASSAHGLSPVIIADLDETLVDSIPRRFLSFQEAFSTICGPAREGDCAKAAGINIIEFLALPNRYAQGTLLQAVGISPEMAEQLQKEMMNIYYGGTYVAKDQSVPGATEFVQELRKTGAKIFFVTSRGDEAQREGTLVSLKNLGFIHDGDEASVMLRSKGMSSIEFKRSSFLKIKSWAESNNGIVELVMENEPENMNAMTDFFPSAAAIFVDGAFVKDEPLKGNPIHVRNFR
ncbi:MAG: HAD family acid phosphatase [Bdellovibrionota bacterium]